MSRLIPSPPPPWASLQWLRDEAAAAQLDVEGVRAHLEDLGVLEDWEEHEACEKVLEFFQRREIRARYQLAHRESELIRRYWSPPSLELLA